MLSPISQFPKTHARIHHRESTEQKNPLASIIEGETNYEKEGRTRKDDRVMAGRQTQASGHGGVGEGLLQSATDTGVKTEWPRKEEAGLGRGRESSKVPELKGHLHFFFSGFSHFSHLPATSTQRHLQ